MISTSLVSLVRDWGLVPLSLWKNFWTLSLSRVLWIYLSMVEVSLGPTTGTPPLCLELTDFSFLLLGRLISQLLLRVGYPDFFRITFLFFFVVVFLRGIEVTLNLKTCD
jgi:hypothetical protein